MAKNKIQKSLLRPVILSNPDSWVKVHGDYLFRYALLRLRDEMLAQDAVQETFLAAFKSRKNFRGQCAEKSWFAGILKNKICDHFRRSTYECSFTDLHFYNNQDADFFIHELIPNNCWMNEDSLHARKSLGTKSDKDEFWKTYRKCIKKLTPTIADAFNLRVVEELPSSEVCAILNVTKCNLWVMLHRARLKLRCCLESDWFEKP